jgi:chromosome segregation ATPase
MNRMNLLYTLDGLLTNCKGCSQGNKPGNPDIKCKGCSFYPQIRWIGNQLGRKKQMAVLTLEEYQDYKAQGMTDTQIAIKKETSPNYIWQLKKKWQISPKQADTATIDKNDGDCKGKENNAKYEQEISDLKAALHLADIAKKSLRNDYCNLQDTLELKDKVIEKQKQEIRESMELCDKYIDEKIELQREFDKVKNNEYNQSYLIEEQKKRIEDLGRTLTLYENENKALRELVRLWI